MHSLWGLGSPIALWVEALQAGAKPSDPEAPDAPQQAMVPFSHTNWLTTVPSPLLGASLPEAILRLGGRQLFWHRHDALCSAPTGEEPGVGDSAKYRYVELRLGGLTPPVPNDYLKAVESEKKREEGRGGAGSRAKKESVIPLGRHLASILLGFAGRDKTLFDRVTEQRPSVTYETGIPLSSVDSVSSMPSARLSAPGPTVRSTVADDMLPQDLS